MKKYQFCIRFRDIDTNSAATKAVEDCASIFRTHGYLDYNFVVGDNRNKARYYINLLTQLTSFFFRMERNSLVGIQYPLLSINKLFKFFIRMGRIKGLRFFCIIHDLESLRTGGTDTRLIAKEIANLNNYDAVISHNEQMTSWLKDKGLRTSTIELGLFDYLSNEPQPLKATRTSNTIVFAGNLGKSTFIYQMAGMRNWQFKVYGPNFNTALCPDDSVIQWSGEFSPDEIVQALEGDYGLIWDGSSMQQPDDILGNYLKYNNPHKCSLYIAAGLPIIAPRASAIGKLIESLQIGFVLSSLAELEELSIPRPRYEQMKRNVLKMQTGLIRGDFFSRALDLIQKEYAVK